MAQSGPSRRSITGEPHEHFRALTERYVDLVYSAARRQVADAHLAEDVTQAVFIILSQKLEQLPADRPLGAWLLRTTAYVAANARRRRAQREFHERRAAEMARDHAQSDQSQENHWGELSPLLDEGVNRLRSGEREALVMRYFEKMSMSEVGAALGITEAAAGKRVSRAIEKLREFFQRRGVTVTAAALSAVLVAKTTEAAPVALASAVSAGTGAGAATTPLVKGSLIMMASTKIKLAVAAGIVLLLGTGVSLVVVQATKRTAEASSSTSAAASGAPPTMTPATWPMVFADGSVVELLGICDESDPAKRWWGADGREIAPPQIADVSRFIFSGGDGRTLRLVIRRNVGSAAGAAMRVDMGPMQNYAGSESVSRGTSITNMIVGVPLTMDTTTVRVGLAGGSWNESVIYDAATSKPATAGQPSLSVGTITEEDGKTLVQVFDSRDKVPVELQESIVVRTADGRVVFPRSSQDGGLGIGITYTFECPREQLMQVVCRWRYYDDWMEMKNVSLRPTTMPTAVSVGPTTQPGAK